MHVPWLEVGSPLVTSRGNGKSKQGGFHGKIIWKINENHLSMESILDFPSCTTRLIRICQWGSENLFWLGIIRHHNPTIWLRVCIDVSGSPPKPPNPLWKLGSREKIVPGIVILRKNKKECAIIPKDVGLATNNVHMHSCVQISCSCI